MLCKKCNSEVLDGAKICPVCGNNLVDGQGFHTVFRADTEESYNFFIRKKTAKAVTLGLICSIIAITSISAIISYFSRPDLTKCIDIAVTGYNGYAYSSYNVNTKALREELFGRSDSASLSYDESVQLEKLTALLEGSVKQSGKWESLYNGDESVLEIVGLQKVADSIGIKFRNKAQISRIASDLPEPKLFSFQDVFSATFYGKDGQGRAQLTIDSSNIPFDIYTYDGELYIDHEPIIYETSGNAGELSNNDTLSLSFSESSKVFSEIINKYGCGFSDDKIDFTVTGLSDLPIIDILSYVDIPFYGVSNDAEMGIEWKEESIIRNHYKIMKADDYDPDYDGFFYIYSDLDLDKNLSIKVIDSASSETTYDYFIGSYAIVGSQMDDLFGGQIIDVSICTDEGENIPADFFNQYGFTVIPLQKQVTVDGSKLSHYVTTVEQLNNEMIKKYANDSLPYIKERILNDWSYIIHGDYDYDCSGKTIKQCILGKNAYFGKWRSYEDTYCLWLIFACTLKDDQMDGEKTMFIVTRTHSLQANPSGSEISNYVEPMVIYCNTEQEMSTRLYSGYNHPENDFHEISLE